MIKSSIIHEIDLGFTKSQATLFRRSNLVELLTIRIPLVFTSETQEKIPERSFSAEGN